MSALLAMALAAITWQELAHDAAPLEAQIARLAPPRQEQVRAVLAGMAACEPTTEGVRAAWDKVVAALPGLEKPDFAGSGEGPNRTALRTAAMKVLRGLVAKTAPTLKTKAEQERLLSTLAALPNMKDETRVWLADEARTHFRG